MEKTLTEETNPDVVAAIIAAIDECFAEIRRLRAEMHAADVKMAEDQEEIEQLRKQFWANLEKFDLELGRA